MDFKLKNSFFIPNPCDKSLDYLRNFSNERDYDIFYAISHGVHRGNLRLGKKDEREEFIGKLIKKCSGINWKIAWKVFFGWIITLVVVGGSTGLLVAQGIYSPSEYGICDNPYLENNSTF